MEIASIIFLHLNHCSGGYEYLLAVTDHFTHYKQAYATRNNISRTALLNDFILSFGIPEHILHDQGKEFDKKLFHKLTKLCGIKPIRTTPYHP